MSDASLHVQSADTARPARVSPAFLCHMVAGLACLAGFALCVGLVPDIVAGSAFVYRLPWLAAAGVHFDVRVDGLSLLFMLLITGIGALIFFYAAAYFHKTRNKTGNEGNTGDKGVRAAVWLVLFAISMLGLVVADNVIMLFVFWEMTTITSFFLIGLSHEKALSRQKAIEALMVTGAGGLAFLVGVLLLGAMAGTFTVSEIVQGRFEDHPLYLATFALIALGCLTKSAQFPFHFWLPGAMAAPAPISAYLHSATMVKAGLFVLARFHPALSGSDVWFWTLSVVGAVTALWAAVLAVRQKDLKLMLAYTTVMALGTVMMCLAGGTPLAVMAGLTFLFVHALYKSTLFLMIGNVEKATGTRAWTELGALGRVMPVSALCAVLAALSMAGVPPFSGFIGKELLYKATGAFPYGTGWIFGAMMVGAAALIGGIGFYLAFRLFRPASWSWRSGAGGEGFHTPRARYPHGLVPVPWMMSWPALVPALAGLVFGLWPAGGGMESLIHAATASVFPDHDPESFKSLKLWHGLDFAVVMSAVTFALAFAVMIRFARVSDISGRLLANLPLSAVDVYQSVVRGSLQLSAHVAHFLQNGRQRFYVMTTFLTLIALALMAYVRTPFLPVLRWDVLAMVPWYHAFLSAMIVFAVAVAVFSHRRLLAICALGVIGTCVALLFALFGAPDVAMTQFMVEILMVIIMSIVMLRLPHFSGYAHGSGKGRWRDIGIAVLAGVIVTVTMLRITSAPFDRHLSTYFEANSYAQAHGQNIVNVILVDFRALDTLGEIVVVTIAGLACFALVTLGRRRRADVS